MTDPSKSLLKTTLPGLYLIERKTFPDERGLFRELYQKDELEKAIGFEFSVPHLLES